MNGSSDGCLELRADGEATPHTAPAGLSGWARMMRRRRSRQELLALDADQLRDRLERNIDLRSAHHHVFNLDLVVACLFETGWGAVAIEARRPYDIVAVARKVDESDPGWGQSVRFGNPFTD